MWTGMNPQPSADSNSLRSTLQKLETSSVGSNQAFSILVLMMAEESAVTLLVNQPSSWERCDQKTERTRFGDRHGLRWFVDRSEEHTSELQSLAYLVCRLLLEKKKNK